jgi:hypothetical protein
MHILKLRAHASSAARGFWRTGGPGSWLAARHVSAGGAACARSSPATPCRMTHDTHPKCTGAKDEGLLPAALARRAARAAHARAPPRRAECPMARRRPGSASRRPGAPASRQAQRCCLVGVRCQRSRLAQPLQGCLRRRARDATARHSGGGWRTCVAACLPRAASEFGRGSARRGARGYEGTC